MTKIDEQVFDPKFQPTRWLFGIQSVSRLVTSDLILAKGGVKIHTRKNYVHNAYTPLSRMMEG